MEKEKRFYEAWKSNTPPPENNPQLNDAFVTIGTEEDKLTGVIQWNRDLKAYAFCFAEMNGDSDFKTYPAKIPRKAYDILVRILKADFGVLWTVDITTPPQDNSITYGTLPESLRPKPVPTK